MHRGATSLTHPLRLIIATPTSLSHVTSRNAPYNGYETHRYKAQWLPLQMTLRGPSATQRRRRLRGTSCFFVRARVLGRARSGQGGGKGGEAGEEGKAEERGGNGKKSEWRKRVSLFEADATQEKGEGGQKSSGSLDCRIYLGEAVTNSKEFQRKYSKKKNIFF